MSAPSPLLRPRDTDALRAELRHIAGQGPVPVLFGGEVDGENLLLSEFVGTRTGRLRGLVVRSSSGLGGASMALGRPLSVADYRNAHSITHDYDGPVLSEGLRSVLAVPVIVDGTPRAMLYGAYRSGDPVAGQAVDLFVESARRLSVELRIRDEVDRRLRMQQALLSASNGATSDPERVRAVHAELLRLASAGTDAVTPEILRTLAGQLSSTARVEDELGVALTGREVDVLAQVALGCSNKLTAQRLSLSTETVKAYLRSAARKLGTTTRHEAVTKARRLRLIP